MLTISIILVNGTGNIRFCVTESIGYHQYIIEVNLSSLPLPYTIKGLPQRDYEVLGKLTSICFVLFSDSQFLSMNIIILNQIFCLICDFKQTF